MDMDPELIEKLLKTFSIELDERCIDITNGLLQLEKNPDASEIVEAVFRAAHNIKGSAHSVGAKNVGDIAHHIETLFQNMKNQSSKINHNIIDLCLDAVDKMRLCLQCFIDKKPLPFNIDEFLSSLKFDDAIKSKKEKIIKPEKSREKKPTRRLAIESDSSIRVSIDNLDRVSALTEEIQVTKIAIDDHYTELTKLSTSAKQSEHVWKETRFILQNTTDHNRENHLEQLYQQSTDNFLTISNSLQQLQKNMYRQINELAILSTSLIDEVRTLRLIPASTLFNTLPRIVREIARELDKPIDLRITGDSVKMDKMVLEGLQDPLIHLLRNAIDHGIENKEIREMYGKSLTGSITIDVREQGDHIIIAVSDDGAGMDLKKIAAVAVKKHLITEAERDTLNDEDILELVFRPGFSTKEIITDLSGRGVGLDVVKSNIDNLKGRIAIETELHKGTTFYLHVPLTLASERGLLIQSSGQAFVLPTNLVERVLILQASEIIDIESSQAILIDGHPIPLQTLATILGLTPYDIHQQDQLPVIVLKKGWRTIAILVEAILNEREIVIKPLQAPLINLPCIAGGTLAGNGQVIIVLNASDLIHRALQDKKTSRITLSKKIEPSTPSRPHILVVDDSITTRTLEKTVLESKDYQVTVAVDGKEAWELLQKQKFTLLITDVMMPNMDGFTLTEHVKKSETLHDLPVIIVTSLGSDAEKKRGIEVGANAYIVKNEFESDKLLDIVSQLV